MAVSSGICVNLLGEVLFCGDCSHRDRLNPREVQQRFRCQCPRLPQPRISEANIDFDFFEYAAILIKSGYVEAIAVDALGGLGALAESYRKIVVELHRSGGLQDLSHRLEVDTYRDVDVRGCACMLEAVFERDAAFEKPRVGCHVTKAREDAIECEEFAQILHRPAKGHASQEPRLQRS